jgi:hypothetical protein
VYEAPFQLKANNGIYLIDDFGRQRATPAEVLNRWIVPMERRIDYLSFLTGGKMTAPFETFLVFSTNLNPADLGDEAFLRRIQYKMLLKGPAENEFIRIFESFCTARKIPFTRELIVRFIDRHYRRTSKVFRRCHPRDVLSHALNLMHFEKLPFALTDEILDRAFDSCFLQEEADNVAVAATAASQPSASVTAAPAPPPPQENPIMPMVTQSCSDYWGDQVAQITTAFGSLAFVAGFRNRLTGGYHDLDSARQYGEAETSRILQKLHIRAFIDWLGLNLEQQKRDLTRYLALDNPGSRFNLEHRELVASLAPFGAKTEDIHRFSQYLAAILDSVLPKPAEPRPEPATVERIA